MSREPLSMRPVVLLFALVILTPTALSIAAGVVLLAMWKEPEDIVVGVLVLSFAAMIVVASILALVLLRRWNRLAKLQAEFVGNISHELRTPLAGIKLLVDDLRLGTVQGEKERARCLDAVAKETDRLTMLVDQLLTWRRVQSKPEFLSEPVPVPELLDGVRREAELVQRVLGQEGPCRVRVTVADACPMVLGDGHALGLAIGNLVHNALKYGPPDQPVELVARPHPTKHGKVVVEVLDRGPGIPDHEKKKVLLQFYRSPSVRGAAHRIPGTGLGLAIVDRIVEGLRGEFRLEDREGGGTAARLVLPAAVRVEEEA